MGQLVTILWVALGIAVLYLWLIGHWFGWVLAFIPIWLLTQMSLNKPTDSTTDFVVRAVVVLVATGIPCLLWGSAARTRAKPVNAPRQLGEHLQHVGDERSASNRRALITSARRQEPTID
jgi:hypothetical protein